MSILKSKVKPSNIRSEEGTAGGRTYYVILPGTKEEKALCFRQIKKDPTLRCTNPAGYDTWHNGSGACKFHGGNNSNHPNIVTGKKAVMTKMRLDDQIQAYLNDDRGKLLDLSYELAASRAMFNEFLNEKFPDPSSEDYGIALHRFTELIGTIGSLVDKISKIENRNSLTTAQVMYLRATVADLLIKYVTDPEGRERAVRELVSRMGGDVSHEMEMRRSEYTLPGGL